jgi:hypothetical protein
LSSRQHSHTCQWLHSTTAACTTCLAPIHLALPVMLNFQGVTPPTREAPLCLLELTGAQVKTPLQTTHFCSSTTKQVCKDKPIMIHNDRAHGIRLHTSGHHITSGGTMMQLPYRQQHKQHRNPTRALLQWKKSSVLGYSRCDLHQLQSPAMASIVKQHHGQGPR